MVKEKKYPKAIYNWPEDERPRERLIKFGADKLSDTELLAILLRVGSSGKSAVDMARELIKEFETFRNIDSKGFSELKRKGLGIAKITQIKAAIEIGKRFLKEKSLTKIKVKTSKDIVDYFIPYLRDMKKEIFKAVLLISACDLVGIKVLDHVIIGDNNYFSFFNEGLIKEE